MGKKSLASARGSHAARQVKQFRSKRTSRFVQQFASRYDHYERLCIETHSLLQAQVSVSKIPVAHVTWRVKKIDSLLEKCRVKNYNDPEKQVTDICGVRLVYLYRKDLPRIERIIKKAFYVCERVERRPAETDQFGYEALHFLVKLTRRSSGPRHELLKDMICEAQPTAVRFALLFEHCARPNLPVHFERAIHPRSFEFDLKEGATPDGALTPPSA